MSVQVQDEGLEYEIKLGHTIEFTLGGKVEAFMERVGPASDSELRIVTVIGQCRGHHC